jgi:hypothetical protein
MKKSSALVVARDFAELFGVSATNVSKALADFVPDKDKVMVASRSVRCLKKGQTSNALTHLGVQKFLELPRIAGRPKNRPIIEWCRANLLPILRGDEGVCLTSRS